MKVIWHLNRHSIRNRAFSTGLAVICIALSVTLLLGVERLRNETRASFASTISGTDLIVGARSGATQLLLYSIFHIGNATNNIEWQSVQALAKHPDVKWVVPLSLGDSHRGFRVLGTDPGFFSHYRYGRAQPLSFASGRPFSSLFEAVIGAEVAERLGYRTGDRMVVAHGANAQVEHSDKPFQVAGILARTGTPVDRSVFVSLEAIEAIHLDWQGGAPIPGFSVKAEEVRRFDLTPKTVTAVLVGLHSRAAVFRVQRHVNEYREEPLLAILPGATLQELWDQISVAEHALLAISGMVVLVGLAGLVAVMSATLGERRRELAILRALGASPRHIFLLLASESLLLTLVGSVLGILLLHALIAALSPWLQAHWGIALTHALPSLREGFLLLAVLLAGLGASLIPAWRAYRLSVADGLTIRV